MSITIAGASDAPLLARYRAAMFVDMGRIGSGDTLELERRSATMLGAMIEDGSYVGWILRDESGAPIGSAGLVIRPMLPRPAAGTRRLLSGREGLVVNVYVEPAWRRRGLAGELMDAVIAWGRDAGLARLVLHASDGGRPLYERLGFAATGEMRLEL